MKKITKSIKAHYLALLLLLVSFNCEDQSPMIDYEEIKVNVNCNLNLKRIKTFKNVVGTVSATQSVISPFIIKGDANSEFHILAPCNLPTELTTDGLEILFSGYRYEDIPGTNSIGPPFEFTQIKVSKESKPGI